MLSSPSDWDAKHKLAAEAPPAEPASIVCELLPLLPTGPALDIACGTGRHALLLAARGQHVTALDFSSVALDILKARAHKLHVPVRQSKSTHPAPKKHLHGGLELIQANLEHIHLPECCYDLILCVQYLQRSLFPKMTRALRPNGVLLMETFTRAQLVSRWPTESGPPARNRRAPGCVPGLASPVLSRTGGWAGNRQPDREEAGQPWLKTLWQ